MKKKTNKKKKRVWCLLAEPSDYNKKCDICGGEHITWSEWEDMIWCHDCKKDTKGTSGGFDGPIGAFASRVLGCPVDMINLKTGMIKTPEHKKPITHKEYRDFIDKTFDKIMSENTGG